MSDELTKARELVKGADLAAIDHNATSTVIDDLAILVGATHPSIANRPGDDEPVKQRGYDEEKERLRRG